MPTYTARTPSELIQALNWPDYVIDLLPDEVYDFTDLGTKSFWIRAAGLNGNNATIKNLHIGRIQKDMGSFSCSDLIMENFRVSAGSTGSEYWDWYGIFDIQYEKEDPELNFVNCQFSGTLDDTTCFVAGKRRVESNTHIHFYFRACSLNINIESPVFRISKLGSYDNDDREAVILFELCKMHINAPNVSGGYYMTDCMHRKCDIYYYMPQWNGTASRSPSGSTSSENAIQGRHYRSCLIRGNLSSLQGGDSISTLLYQDSDVSILCAHVSPAFIDTAGQTAAFQDFMQMRRMTEDQARDPIIVGAVSMFNRKRFELYDAETAGEEDWYIDPYVNDGLPHIDIMPGLIRVYPVIVGKKKLRIYDMSSVQTDFERNGLAILDATEATIHEVYNGEYSLAFTHPIDKNGKWRFIRESNIVRCQGQLFTIVSCVWKYTSQNTGYVSATCEHIFYQNNDHWIYPENIPLQPLQTCKSAMDAIMGATTDYDDEHMHRFTYEWESDWEFSTPFVMSELSEGCTPVSAFIGSGGITAQKGGELYRDNFYFSINERMENAKDDAFDIRFENNAAGITRTVDTSSFCTFFKLYDSRTLSYYMVSYSNAGFPLFQFPHTIVRSQMYTFPEEIYDAVERGEVDICELLSQIGLQIWMSMCTPVLCYEVDIADYVKYTQGGKEFDQKYRVGDSGRIHDKLLGLDISLKITETETDGLTGKCKRVTFGSKNSLTRAAGYPKPFSGDETYYQSVVVRVHDKSEFPIRDRTGRKIVKEVEMNGD